MPPPPPPSPHPFTVNSCHLLSDTVLTYVFGVICERSLIALDTGKDKQIEFITIILK